MIYNKVLLRNTCRAWGIQPSYLVNNEKPVWAPEKSLIKVLGDLTKTSLNTNEDLQKLFQLRRQKQIAAGMEKSLVLWGGKPRPAYLYFSEGQKNSKFTATVTLESGEKKNLTLKTLGETVRKNYDRVQIQWNETLELGYHKLEITSENRTFTSLLICAPEKLETAKELSHSWGPFVPLYALRTGEEWGIGSIKEMKQALQTCGQFGAKWLGTLPLLAVNLDKPDCDPSPYSALTRLFWNEVFLDVEALVEKYNSERARSVIKQADFQKELEAVRATTHVDYHRVYKLKKQVLKILSDEFFASKTDAQPAYQKFLKDNPEIDGYAKFRSQESSEQNFHSFVQFEMNECLRELSETLPQGLYLDFPVGVNDYGYDFKEFNSVFFKEVSVGAPPEEVFQQGQDWGFPSFNPYTHRDEGYQYLRKSLRNHLKYCKILRMDHIMGLYRVYCIPKGFTGHDGVYLRFPKEDLFAISMLEAQRAKADLVGENLGTVPMAVDNILNQRNINGMWVLQMETWRDPAITFQLSPRNAMISFNNHDMAMWASFVKGADLTLVNSLKILSDESLIQFQKERKKQMEKWEEFTAPENLTIKLHEEMAKTPSKYFVVNLEDLWEEEAPQNIPGTWKEYPNWRHKYAKKISQWIETPMLKSTFEILKKYRG